MNAGEHGKWELGRHWNGGGAEVGRATTMRRSCKTATLEWWGSNDAGTR